MIQTPSMTSHTSQLPSHTLYKSSNHQHSILLVAPGLNELIPQNNRAVCLLCDNLSTKLSAAITGGGGGKGGVTIVNAHILAEVFVVFGRDCRSVVWCKSTWNGCVVRAREAILAMLSTCDNHKFTHSLHVSFHRSSHHSLLCFLIWL